MLSWREAGLADRERLQHFTCADPPKAKWDRHRRRKHHPRPWELEVQSYFRQAKVPLRATGGREYMYLLNDGGKVLSVAHFGYSRAEEQFLIYAIARSVHSGGRGTGAATLGLTLAFLRTVKSHHKLDCGAFARIHPENERSRRMFGEAGFERLGTFDQLEAWVHELN